MVRTLTRWLFPLAGAALALLTIIGSLDTRWIQGAGSLLAYSQFFWLGLAGALIANSTGAGGGIVFVPAFSAFGLEEAEVVGTSILIQCFGMSAGALAWLRNVQRTGNSLELETIRGVLLVGGLSSIAGVLTGQYGFKLERDLVNTVFQLFSVVVGSTLLWTTLRSKDKTGALTHPLGRIVAYEAVCFVAFIGGLLISLISVGTGELMALLLIVAGVPITTAVCCAVCLSSLSVLCAAPFHITAETVHWAVVFFAAPAALFGGTLAHHICRLLGPRRLKLFFSGWILLSGLFV